MEDEKVLRGQLLALIQGGNAHRSLDEAVADFPMEKINSQAPGLSYTPWRLLEHIRIAQWDILEFVINPKHVSPEWPAGYWPLEGEQADAGKWEQTLSGIRRDRAALVDLVKDPRLDLLGPIPHAPGYTIIREILVAADHNAYHTGEFGILRDILEAS